MSQHQCQWLYSITQLFFDIFFVSSVPEGYQDCGATLLRVFINYGGTGEGDRREKSQRYLGRDIHVLRKVLGRDFSRSELTKSRTTSGWKGDGHVCCYL